MLKRLANIMRGVSLDAAFISDSKTSEIVASASVQKRIIVTRNQKIFEMKKTVPCFYFNTVDTDEQLRILIDTLKIRVTDKSLLSRCTKCNGVSLLLIKPEEAQRTLQWKNLDDFNSYNEFLKCKDCGQIYWEGTTFKSAKEKFNAFKTVEESKEN